MRFLGPFLGVLGGALTTSADEPSWSPQMIEADWALQESRRSLPSTGQPAVTSAEDAAGAVDGVKNGRWGFHTANEEEPWWQVDLETPVPLSRLVVWNRCEGHADRNSRLRVLLSVDGQDFREVYRHSGEAFFGFSDGQPLVIHLAGEEARFVRLTPGVAGYFHLDEVEVMGADGTTNLALNRPASQSSTSTWSARHGAGGPGRVRLVVGLVERGLRLADRLEQMGADVRERRRVLQRALELSGRVEPDAESGLALYREARWQVRELALSNPLLDFDSVLFVKKAAPMFPHMSDQHYGWWSRGGGGVWVLDGLRSDRRRVRCLTSDWPDGSFTAPELSYDGTRVLFAYARFFPDVADHPNKTDRASLPEESFYHIFEMDLDGGNRRQLSRGRYDDFDPRYLPDGRIVFVSTRKGTVLQVSAAASEATRQADLPLSYVRCGGDDRRPVPVFTLHGMNADGTGLHPLSAFENFEWTPSVANDGRLLFTRWDYIDRFNGHFFSLWSASQDGSNPQLVYGNFTVAPQVILEARSIPDSAKLVFTACAHHSNTGGSLVLLDRDRGLEGLEPITRLTPEVCFPETEGSPEHHYAHPWPLSEEFFLVSWAGTPLPPHAYVRDHRNPPNALGLYLYDAFGNLELLYRDPEISSAYPVPVRPRPRPPAQTGLVQSEAADTGAFLIQDVAAGLDPRHRDTIRRLRIIAVSPKVQPYMNVPELGVSREDTGKYVLGTVPVESDGSAYFRVPSGVPVFFQALDGQGLAVQTMRTLTYVTPGQTLACIGCHEHRDLAPAAAQPLLAARRPASVPRPGPEGSWPLRFDRLVQPVLERHCVSCHNPDGRDSGAAQLDLTAEHSWTSLLDFGGEDLRRLAFERDASLPGQGVAANSRLWRLLTQPGGHAEVALDGEAQERLAAWMDIYAQRAGSFSDDQERELAEFRTQWLQATRP